jgi:segregation and condensation protein B
MDPVAEPTTPEDLGRTYAAVLEGADLPAPLPSSAAEKNETPPDPLRIIEAALFVGGRPLTCERACELVRGLTAEQFAQAIDTLNHDYRRQGRPYTIQAQEQGYLLTLRPRFRGVIEKVYGGPREARLSHTAIDVLALVAYRQPVTKSDVDSLRGAESGSLLRQLVRRGLIQVMHQDDADKKGEVSYVTSPRFLQLFGLGSLEDLPRTQDLQQM